MHALIDPIFAYLFPVLITLISGAVIWALVKIAGHFKVQISEARQQQIRQAVADGVAYAEQIAATKAGISGAQKKDMALTAVLGELENAGIGLARDVAGAKIESFLGHGKLAEAAAQAVQGFAPPQIGAAPKA